MENDEPSIRKTRWPSQRPVASVAGIKTWTMSRRTARKTASGSRLRAWQKALAVKARPASKETWVKAVLPWRTWMRNQWMMAAGVKRQLCAPGVSGGSAGGVDEVAAELGGEVLSEGVERGRNPAMHRGASCAMVVVRNTMVHGGPVFLKTRAVCG